MKLSCLAIVMVFGVVLDYAIAQENRRTSVDKGGEIADQAVLESLKAVVPPDVDGKIDQAWDKANVCEVVVREAFGGCGPVVVRLRALHSDDTLYVLAEWEDSTKSDMRDPFVWNKEKNKYERPTKPDDQFALQFPLSGDFDINMLSMDKEFISDVWHWKAGRGNPNGWVDDKRHIISRTNVEGAKLYDMGGHGKVYIARPMDVGTPSYKTRETPKKYEGDLIDSFIPQDPTGSLADVRGKGVHNGKGWTLEVSRKFKTGNEDDAIIDVGKDNVCAVAVLNDELYWNHSISKIIRLRFLR